MVELSERKLSIEVQRNEEVLARPFNGCCFRHAPSLADEAWKVESTPMETTTSAYAIFIDALAEGSVPSVRDGEDMPCVFPTRLAAEREIAENLMTRLREFMDGDRDFEDAITVEEYVVDVDVLPDGSIVDADGNHFGSRCKAI